MPSFLPLATLTAILAATTASATSITFQNTSPNPICYMAELSSGTFPSTAPCGPGPGIPVPAGATTVVPLAPSFNGALTAFLGNTRGARYEVNFAATSSATWYDADYQLGLSSGTIAPADNRKLANGGDSVAGEPDPLAKANAAWPSTTNQAALLSLPDYLKQGPDGKLTFVYCDSDAPQEIIDFFQITADFNAYIDAGSIAGVVATDIEAVKLADEKSLQVDTQDMKIVAY